MRSVCTASRGGVAVALAVGIVGAVGLPASADPVPADTPGLPVELEAEDATLAGGVGVNDNHLGFSGTGFVDGFILDHAGTAAVTFTVEVPVAGEYGVNLRYANGLGSDMTISQVAAGEDRQITLPSAVGAGWDLWFVHQEVVDLPAGQQRITYRFDADDTGNVNLDAIALTAIGDLDTPGGGPTDPGSVEGPGPDTRWDDVTDVVPTTKGRRGRSYEAEDAFFANGAVAASVDGGGGVDVSAARARLVVPVNAGRSGDAAITFRYLNAGDAPTDLVLAVNGAPLGRLVLPRTDTWEDIAVPVTLARGLASVELRRTGTAAAAGLVIDRVVLRDGEPLAERGATVPFEAYEAEHGRTNGEVLEPSRAFRDLAAEATGRQAVELADTGDYVEWRLTEPTSSLVLRASIPDTEDGTGRTATLGVYAGKHKVTDVEVSSEYAWVYGGYPYGNDPSQGGAQRFFDETRVTFDELPPGTVLRIAKDTASAALPYTVDLVETELVPEPLAAPAGFVDVRRHGATSADGTDDTEAFVAAVAHARELGTGVWVPEGRFTLTDRLRVAAVTIRGAGPWYSVIEGRDGKGGLFATGSGVTVADLMIDGDVRYRDDARFDAALEGRFGQGSLLQNVWIEHTKVGLWADSGTEGLYALGLRVRNTFADGVHFHGAVTDSRTDHTVVRNTGDDAMAMWSAGGPVTRSVFAHSTVQTPLLGNGAAVYGGDSNRIEHNVIRDTLTASAGIAVSTRFNPVPFSGTTVVDGNTVIRSGGWEPNWSTSFGAIWIFTDTSRITSPVVVRDTDIIDSSYEGLLVSGNHPVDDLRVSDVTIQNTGSYAVAVRVGGDHQLADVRASGIPGDASGQASQFWGNLIDLGGNVGLLEPVPAVCAVDYDIQRADHDDVKVRMTLTNTGREPIAGWRLAWHVAGGQAVTWANGAALVQDGSYVTASDTDGRSLLPGKSVRFGFVASSDGGAVAPAVITLDGVPCTVS